MTWRPRPRAWMGVGALVAVCAAAAWFEARSSWLQARLLAPIAREASWRLGPGPSPAIRFPGPGPYDLADGYARIPAFTARLEGEGWRIAEQARMSPRMLALADAGLTPPYPEKNATGLQVRDARGGLLYAATFPAATYPDFASIPPLLVGSLLFVEDRGLLAPGDPTRNPAISWTRFSRAVLDQLRHRVEASGPTPGGSTLATQIEKFRHSPGGRTDTGWDKLRQMASASLRAYRDGPDTLAARRGIVVAYLDTVPLAARPGIGAVHGLRDGLRAWYGRDPAEVDRLLRTAPTTAAGLAARGLAYKQALSLMIAQRAPSHYLLQDPHGLEALTDRYLVRLGAAGVIDPSLRDAARRAHLVMAPPQRPAPTTGFVALKAATAARVRLSQLLGVDDLYALDHLDLRADSTIDDAAQQAVTARLREVGTAAGAQAAGLYGHNMLAPGADPSHILYSFTLYEHVGGADLLRVQTDSGDQPFDINQGARLNLGSTAKLRTVITYLQIVESLHRQYASLDPAALRAVPADPADPIRTWAIGYLLGSRDHALAPMLDAALQRRYSASPGEAFFTGGAPQRFSNFDREDDGRVLTVAEAFQHSVNLVFVRLMRDIVRHELEAAPVPASRELADPALRQRDLERFAEAEGGVFVQRFYDQDRTAPRDVLQANLGLARLHPLQRWVDAYLLAHPRAGRAEVLGASREARLQAYDWLLRSRERPRQDRRIREVLEGDAYRRIAASWRALGYPFATITPSYACALGASGDRPAALAELIGMVVAGGVRAPMRQFTRIDFATGTPYATRMVPPPASGTRVLAPEIAAALRPLLGSVVDGGTAIRLHGAWHLSDGRTIAVGGKTGTGDQRFDVYASGARLLESRRVNRSATFVFFIGDRFFGTITAYVHEPYAASQRFTSAMTVQLLRDLTPDLLPLVAPGAHLASLPASGAAAQD